MEALQIILKDSLDLDLVILDISLPYVNGLQVLEIIRSHHSLDQLPIVACTAHDSKDEVAKILQYGVGDFILKPSARAVIVGKIAAVLKKSGSLQPYFART